MQDWEGDKEVDRPQPQAGGQGWEDRQAGEVRTRLTVGGFRGHTPFVAHLQRTKEGPSGSQDSPLAHSYIKVPDTPKSSTISSSSPHLSHAPSSSTL